MKTVRFLAIAVMLLTLLFITSNYLLKDEEFQGIKIIIQGFLIGFVFSLVFALYNRKKKIAMNPETKNNIINAIPLIIIAFVIYRFFNSSVFETIMSNGNEEIKDFVKKSFSWGICFGALNVIFIKYLTKILNTNNK